MCAMSSYRPAAQPARELSTSAETIAIAGQPTAAQLGPAEAPGYRLDGVPLPSRLMNPTCCLWQPPIIISMNKTTAAQPGLTWVLPIPSHKDGFRLSPPISARTRVASTVSIFGSAMSGYTAADAQPRLHPPLAERIAARLLRADGQDHLPAQPVLTTMWGTSLSIPRWRSIRVPECCRRMVGCIAILIWAPIARILTGPDQTLDFMQSGSGR